LKTKKEEKKRKESAELREQKIYSWHVTIVIGLIIFMASFAIS
jgi:hypothetical protein